MDPSSYQSTYDSLAGQYQPQTDLINSQIADLPRQQQAVTDSLNQAKVNAFKDITNSANSKGVLFSGVPIDQQATYTGTKYLPALAQNQTAFLNTKNILLGQINSLQSARQRQAQDSVSAYQKAQQDNAYKQAQLELGYARLNSSNANSAADRAARSANTVNPAAGFSVKQLGSGNKAYTGPNGQTNLYQYAAALGGGDPNATFREIVNQLSSGSRTDKGAAKAISKLPMDKAISYLKTHNSYIFN